MVDVFPITLADSAGLHQLGTGLIIFYPLGDVLRLCVVAAILTLNLSRRAV